MSDFSDVEGHVVTVEEIEQRIAKRLDAIVEFKAVNNDGELESFRREELLTVLVTGLDSLPEGRKEHFRRWLFRKALRLSKIDATVANIVMYHGLQGMDGTFVVGHNRWVVTHGYYHRGKKMRAAHLAKLEAEQESN